ncbi:DUF4912 domain-containing protein [Candidatus Magnetominusculus xianensis]|uniref:DUF4912 domain-containing protein n=1 Tax=Candidatus Magnetominusculus xianensis TaxID=1748249 RepID=A0ABR5SLE9_9BACT|nr:DUF4912 domain-containing protein [Candidatus Magnetominusculus xianensis]KWT90961.1 hypothetical protein ASN18_1045 [Candidatus Magnetominusculus xianensis]MBF0403116.1 DUF4912 domain-containing protein [Nitrospirota bacterium]
MEDTLVKTEGQGKDKPREAREDGHGIAYLLSDTLKYPIVENYEIPTKYDTDTLVILPVTEKKVYLYWELTEKLLMEKTQNPSASYFTVKIYEVTLGEKKNYREQEIYSAAVSEPFGQIYVECTDNFKPMTAAIGIERDGVFTVILKANQINVPSFSVLGLKEEFWSKGILYTEEKNVDEVMENTKNAELQGGKSDIFEKEMEIISKFLDIRFKDTENIELLLRLIEKIKHLSEDDKAMFELIKSFFETRAKDIQLLSMFLEFLKFLGLKDDSRGSIMKYFEQLMGNSGSSEMSGEKPGSSEMSGSSELLSGKRS